MASHVAGTGHRHLQLELSPDEHAPAAARRALRSLPLDPRPVDALLLTSELVTNALVHGGRDGPIELHAECEPGRCTRVEVHDHGRGFDPRRSGYGLRMLTAAANRWGIEVNGSTCVWFELR